MAKKLKKCLKCGNTYPYSGFYKSKTAKDGLLTPCRLCRTKTGRTHKIRNRYRVRNRISQVLCNGCDKWLPAENFAKARTGYRSLCRKCGVRATKRYVESNPEKILAGQTRRKALLDGSESFISPNADERILLIAARTRYRNYVTAEEKAHRKSRERRIRLKEGGNIPQMRKREQKVPFEIYFKKLRESNGQCECCGKVLDMGVRSTDFVVDHCHKTGLLRGILCNPCNLAIGSFADSIVFLTFAKRYLEVNHAKRQMP